MDVEILPASIVNCWDSPPVCVLHQRDEGTLADIILYLDKKATNQPMHKAWKKFVWPPASSASPIPRQNELLGFIQGWTVEFGPTMPPTQFHMSGPMGEFICFAWGLIYEGTVLAYDQMTNGTAWTPVCGTMGDLLRVEEMSALVLCNLVPHICDA